MGSEDGEEELPLEGLELRREEVEGEGVRSFGCFIGDLSLRMKEEILCRVEGGREGREDSGS